MVPVRLGDGGGTLGHHPAEAGDFAKLTDLHFLEGPGCRDLFRIGWLDGVQRLHLARSAAPVEAFEDASPDCAFVLHARLYRRIALLCARMRNAQQGVQFLSLEFRGRGLLGARTISTQEIVDGAGQPFGPLLFVHVRSPLVWRRSRSLRSARNTVTRTLTSLVLSTFAISRFVSSASNFRAMISCSRRGNWRTSCESEASRSLCRTVSSGPRGCEWISVSQAASCAARAAGFVFRQCDETSLRAIVNSQDPNESGERKERILMKAFSNTSETISSEISLSCTRPYT